MRFQIWPIALGLAGLLGVGVQPAPAQSASCVTPSSIKVVETPQALIDRTATLDAPLETTLEESEHTVGLISFPADAQQGSFESPSVGMTWWRIRHTLTIRLDDQTDRNDGRVRILPTINGLATIQAIIEPSPTGRTQLRVLDTDTGTQTYEVPPDRTCVVLKSEAYLSQRSVQPGDLPLKIQIQPYGDGQVNGTVSISDVALIESEEFPGGFRLEDVIYRAFGTHEIEVGARVVPHLPRVPGQVTLTVAPMQRNWDPACDGLTGSSAATVGELPVSMAVNMTAGRTKVTCRLRISAAGSRDQQSASVVVDVTLDPHERGLDVAPLALSGCALVLGAVLVKPRRRLSSDEPRR